MGDHVVPVTDPQLQFCPATEGDFDGIMAISGDVYRGMDYLPTRYNSWLQDTKRRTFVAKRNGQVVALESVCLVDDGSTAVVEGLRVAPWERGQGVAGIIQRFVKDLVKSEFPAVKVIRLTRIENPPPAMLSEYRLLHSKAVLSLIFKAEEVQEKVHAFISKMEKEGQHFQSPVTLGPEEVKRVYTREAVIEKLLPGRMLIQSWLPLNLVRSNMDYLLAKGLSWMADSTEEPSFLSLGTPPIMVPLGGNSQRFDIDLFGTDPRSAKIHCLAQLLTITEVKHRDFLGCFVFMEKPLFSTLDLFFKDIERFALLSEQLVMEKDI